MFIKVINVSWGKQIMLHTYTLFDLVLSDMKATNKKQIFKDLARAISKKTGIGESQLTVKLASQDKEVSTSIGHGISMPQIKVSSLTQPYVALARVKNCSEFDSVDGEPVDMICCILTPETMTGEHLQRIASLSRLFSNKILCDKLRAAEDQDNIKQIIMDVTAMRRAA